MDVTLREVRDGDLPVFSRLTGHGSATIRPSSCAPSLARTVRSSGCGFGPPEEREVTCWIGREHRGRGAATAALRGLLGVVSERPLRGRAAADNGGEEIDEVVLTLAH
ncbi:MAG: hypothetical protein QOF44_2753 [Streptomyces sp.]|nr:hypothetical protein [Streptomyces sp.]